MNKLKDETSPYLLQHANNPVEWYAWKEEAFEKAKREDKPILVSIGYSTCHWCHVMEHESFEDQEIAAFMNAHFVNIKVDREERPDVDQIYMDACQLINGSGGWPLNCFLLPDGKPFFAGTYFPPKPAHNRPSWKQVLNNMHLAYQDQREKVVTQAERLTQNIKTGQKKFTNQTLLQQKNEQVFTTDLLGEISQQLAKQYDEINGGFGNAPKFPGAMLLSFMLDYYHNVKDEAVNKHIHFTLEKMISGGIYDQLGGGFARYAVDAEWLVPHFEKMLYDNALMLEVIIEAYKQTPKPFYETAIRQSLAFIERELRSPNGGFYAALDADSEGKEGTYYIWSQKEIERLLGNEAPLFSDYYGVKKGGNWEGQNILWRSKPLEETAQKHGLSINELDEKLSKSRKILFDHRAQRISPGLDDKHLLDWNALMIITYCKAYQALGDDHYLNIALEAIQFIQTNFTNQDNQLWHTYKNGKAQYDAFLDGYAFWIAALIEAYNITFDLTFIDQATTYTEFVINQFLDTTDNLFYFTSENQKDIPLRRKELFDNALPSGNATMVVNLQKLAIIKGNKEWESLAIKMLKSTKDAVVGHPRAFGRWAKALLYQTYIPKEVVIVGGQAKEMALEMQKRLLTNTIVMAHETGDIENYPLLKGRKASTNTLIYVCQNYQCQLPVKTIAEAQMLLLS